MAIKYVGAKRIQGTAADKAGLAAYSVADANASEMTLNGGTWRGIGMKIESGNSLIGTVLTSFTIKLKRDSGSGSEASTMSFGVFDSTASTTNTPRSGGVFTISGVTQLQHLTTSYVTYTATGSATLAAGDLIGIVTNSVHPRFPSVYFNSSVSPASNFDPLKFDNPSGGGGDGWEADGGINALSMITTWNGTGKIPTETIFEETDTRKDYWQTSGVWTE